MSHTFCQSLGLNQVGDLRPFFEPGQYLINKIRRLVHFIFTGIWINEHTVGQMLNEHRLIVGKELEPQFLKRVYRAAMEETALQRLENGLRMLWRFIQSPTTVGACWPSSKSLATAMIRSIPKEGPPRRFLEVGGGTGQFTYELIVHKLRPQDTLDVIEFDERFIKILRRRFEHLPNVRIIQADFTQYPFHEKYEYCLSSLPLAGFPVPLVERVYEVFSSVIKRGGYLHYFEYPGFPPVKNFVLRGKKRESFQSVLKIKRDNFLSHRGQSTSVWLNFPPARVCKLRY